MVSILSVPKIDTKKVRTDLLKCESEKKSYQQSNYRHDFL